MEWTVLGATGMRVSRLCLGTLLFGPGGNADPDDCARIVHRALAAGINFIDTADAYGGGQSEAIVGRAIKGRRESLVLGTKFFFPMSADPNHRGASRRWIVQAVEASLTRLGTDYIDLYQMHRFDEDTDLDEVLFTLTELVRQGKIRAFGSSLFPADRIVEAQWTAQTRGYLRLRCEQSPYSIFHRDPERFVLPACRRHGMGMMAFSPLDEGFLTGRYRSFDDLTPTSRVGGRARAVKGRIDPGDPAIRRKLEVAGELAALAQALGVTPAQLAIAFVLEHPGVTAAIIGPRTIEQLDGLLPAGRLRLPAEALDRIDALVPPGTSLNPLGDMPSGLTPAMLRRPR
jgi:aryl-alcohol dehydrogenase-like predicted oxidoreductase